MANWGGAAGGAMTGFALGGPVGAGIGGLVGLFSKKKKKAKIEDLRSPEQKAAQASLAQLGQTGSFGGINLGEAYGGALGNYAQTDAEKQGLSNLQGLYGGQDIQTSRNVLTDLATTKFNPDDPSSGYAAFSRALAKAGKKSSDVLNRESAITGSRYGTAIGGRKEELAADLANQRGTFLANLYNQGENRKLAGAQGLQGLVGTQQNLANDIAIQGAIERQLKDQQARDSLNEFKRQRSEKLSRIDLMTASANRNPYSGVTSLPSSPSPFSKLASGVLDSFGKGIGTNLAKGDFGSMFGGGTSGIFGRLKGYGRNTPSGVTDTGVFSLFNR